MEKHAPRPVSLYHVKAILKNAITEGKDYNKALQNSGLSPSILENDDALISAEQCSRLLAHTVVLMKDEMLGYTTKPLLPGSWEMLCHACITSATLSEVIERCCKFLNVLDFGFEPRMVRIDDVIEIHAGTPAGVQYDTFPYEVCLVNMHRFCSWMLKLHLPILSVDLPYGEPAHSDEYKRFFLGAPINWNQETCCFKLNQKTLSLPVRQDLVSLSTLLKRPSFDLMTLHYDDQSWTEKIRLLLRDNVSEIPDFIEVADQLGIHQQTLRRRLHDEGTSYRDIKNDLRRDIAIHYLAQPEISIEDVSFKSGFSESSSFSRAFKSWTGITPQAYREKQVWETTAAEK